MQHSVRRPVIRSAPPLRLLMNGLLLSGLFLSASSGVFAMNLLQAFEAAQQQDATILAARATARVGQERLPQAQAQLLPNISASLGHQRNQLNNLAPDLSGRQELTHYPSSNQTLTLRQPLYRPFLAAQYRQAVAQGDDASAVLAQEEQNLAVRVSGAYFEALLTREQLDLHMAQRTSYLAQLDMARKALTAGAGTRTDIDEAQTQLDMNTALTIEARQNVLYTLRQLELLVNQPAHPLARLDVEKLELLEPQPNNLDEWSMRAEKNSPQLRSLQAQVEIARQEVDKGRSAHLPTLDAVAQLSRSESENVNNLQSRYTNLSVGVQLTVPLFAGGYVNSSVRQALAAQDRAEQLLEAGRRALTLRVHKEFRGVTESIAKIYALEQALRSADQLVLSNQKSLSAGSRRVVDILNAQQQRMLVLRDLAQARYIYLLSRVRLLAQVGGADIDIITAINLLMVSLPLQDASNEANAVRPAAPP